jgi:hypothetical protein
MVRVWFLLILCGVGLVWPSASFALTKADEAQLFRFWDVVKYHCAGCQVDMSPTLDNRAVVGKAILFKKNDVLIPTQQSCQDKVDYTAVAPQDFALFLKHITQTQDTIQALFPKPVQGRVLAGRILCRSGFPRVIGVFFFPEKDRGFMLGDYGALYELKARTGKGK